MRRELGVMAMLLLGAQAQAADRWVAVWADAWLYPTKAQDAGSFRLSSQLVDRAREPQGLRVARLVREVDDDWVVVETRPQDRPPHCHAPLQTTGVALRVYVRRADLGQVVRRVVSREGPKATWLELLPGAGVVASEGRYLHRSGAWSLSLALAAEDIGSVYQLAPSDVVEPPAEDPNAPVSFASFLVKPESADPRRRSQAQVLRRGNARWLGADTLIAAPDGSFEALATVRQVVERGDVAGGRLRVTRYGPCGAIEGFIAAPTLDKVQTGGWFGSVPDPLAPGWHVLAGTVVRWADGREAGTVVERVSFPVAQVVHDKDAGTLCMPLQAAEAHGEATVCVHDSKATLFKEQLPPELAPDDLVVRTKVDPVMPRLADKYLRDDQHRCVAHVTIGAGGQPQALEVEGCIKPLAKSVEAAVQQWRWQPVTVDGQGVVVRTTLPFLFRVR